MAQILIADDHKDFRDAVRLMLEQQGHQVLDAEDGMEAVMQWRTHRPDLLILDVFMPGKNGIEALWSIRDQDASARVIVVTAGSGTRATAVNSEAEEVLEVAKLFGASQVLRKPVEPRALLDAVATSLAAPSP